MTRFGILTLGILLLLLGSACTGTGGAVLPSPAATTPTAMPPTATPTSVPPTTLQVWLPPECDPQAATPAAEILRARLEAFAAAEGLALDVRIKAPEGMGGMLPTLTDAELVAPGAVPEVLLLPRSAFEAAALKGLLMPLSAVPEAPLPSAADTFPYALALAQVQGIAYGVPLAGQALALYYPAGAFPEGVPATWSDLVASEGLPWRWAAGDPQARLLLGIYRAAGGTIRSDEGRPSLDTTVLTRVLQDFADLTARGLVVPSLLDLHDDATVWQYYGSSPNSLLFVPQTYLPQAADAWRISLIPGEDGQPWSWAEGYLWAVPRQSSPRLALAGRWLQAAADPTFVGPWTEVQGFLPPTEAALQAWQQSDLAAQMRPFAQGAQPLPSLDVLTTLGPPLQEALAQVINGTASPEEAARQAVQALNAP